MHIVALGWAYVVLMMVLAEALGPGGSVLGALTTGLLYGVLPLAIVLYIGGTRARAHGRARERERERQRTLDGVDPGGGAEAPGAPVAPIGKES